METPASALALGPRDQSNALTIRTTDGLDIHSTPKHGSWLNMADIELSVLQRQCLGQRFTDRSTMEAAVAAWVAARNASAAGIDWQFTTNDAWIKLRRLYRAYDE